MGQQTDSPRGPAALERMSTTEGVVARTLRGERFRWSDLLFHGVLILTLLVAIAVLILLFTTVAVKGVPVLADRGANFFTTSNSSFAFNAGVRQAIIGSLELMLFVVLFAVPIGVGAAVYLEEYAKDTPFTRFLATNVRNLAGVPSIVYGILGLIIFAEFLRPITGGLTVISGGLTLAVVVLPIVIITSSEAIRAVPATIREAGFGVGATRWEVIRSHVLPSAAPGIFTGTVLTLGRAIGETAPLLLVGAILGFFSPGNVGFFGQLRGPYTSLPTVIFSWSTLPNSDFRGLTAAAIIVLMGVLLVINATAIILRNRYERTW
jgi:phosphate transport system permease protein